MTFELWAAFVAASTVMLVIPGPTILTVISYSVAHGTRAIAPQLWILSITFVLLATLNATLYAVFAGTARRILTSPAAQKRFNFAGGSLLSTAGIWALTARHPTA